jgi:hypothetical protein
VSLVHKEIVAGKACGPMQTHIVKEIKSHGIQNHGNLYAHYQENACRANLELLTHGPVSMVHKAPKAIRAYKAIKAFKEKLE